ncbi:hypothetical protein [Nostoc sp.]|uniref:hypothetical protein n=1 Tax=Nostoc sp. TaxID=1180 RepID=UPI002FF8DC4A
MREKNSVHLYSFFPVPSPQSPVPSPQSLRVIQESNRIAIYIHAFDADSLLEQLKQERWSILLVIWD